LIGENIRYKNYGWKDMSIPGSVNFMLDIVKDMGVTIKDEKKKVLVHCHAGYGRTGVVIACYLLFESNHSLDKVIEFIRSKRNQCIQKKKQLEFCKRFKECIIKFNHRY
jgi:protein tyrosine phosphatase domain-containing protein 1